MATVPTDNGVTLDQFNQALRASPAWSDYLRRQGYQRPTEQAIKLNDRQRKGLQRELEATGMVFPKGMEIDPAGHINQDQGMSRLWANPVFRWSVIGGVALASLGAAGWGPLAGVMGGGGGAGAAVGAGAGASTVAGAAGTAGAVSSLPAWLAPTLQYGLPVAASIYGGHQQGRALTESARIEADYANRALAAAQEEQQYRRKFDEDERDHRRTQFADYTRGLEPYRAAGASSVDYASRLLGNSSYQPLGSQAPRSVGAGQTPAAAQAAPQGAPQAPAPGMSSPQAPAQERMVMIQAPSGQSRQVPESQVQHYVSRGGKVVG